MTLCFLRPWEQPLLLARLTPRMTLPTNDLKLAVRGLFRSPLFSIVAILSLALGIGANTAIFTLIDQILLRKLPVKNPDELVMLYQSGPHSGSNMGSRMHSYPIYQEYQKRAEPLGEVIARRLADASIASTTRPSASTSRWCRATTSRCSASGRPPAASSIRRKTIRSTRATPSVVISYDYWTRRFNRDQQAVGKKILVNNYPMTIVGVSAAGFAGIDPARSPQMRVPILMKPVIVPEWGWVRMDDERTRWVQVFARLKPGYTIESAQGPLQGLFTQIRQHEMTLPGAKNWTPFIREQFMTGAVEGREGRRRLLAAAQRLLDRAGRVDGDGRPRAADRLRERREPADRARLHAPARDRGAAVARRDPRPTGAAAADRERAAVADRRRARHRVVGGVDARVDRPHSAAAAAADSTDAGSAHPVVHVRADARHRHRVRVAAGAARRAIPTSGRRSRTRSAGSRAPADRSSCARAWSPRRSR